MNKSNNFLVRAERVIKSVWRIPVLRLTEIGFNGWTNRQPLSFHQPNMFTVII